jgi:fibrillarin-like pre-rRNA processing protein
MLKPAGRLLLVVKARSIDVLKDPERVFQEEMSRLEGAGFRVESIIELSPFEKDHALILATR